MKYFLLLILTCLGFISCNQSTTVTEPIPSNKIMAGFFHRYYEESSRLFPLMATLFGNNTYNDKLPADFTNSYRDTLRIFYKKNLTGISAFDREKLNTSDKISYDIFKREMEINLEGLTFSDNYTPSNQFSAIPLYFGQAGSGGSFQPFKTVKDYENWLGRINGFSAWVDSAIIYFRKGIAENYVLPAALVSKMIPQMESMVTSDPTKSLFYGPIKNMPSSFSKEDSTRLKEMYEKAILEKIIPAYKKIGVFLKQEYLSKARKSSGINAVPDGDKYYTYLVRQQTTTNKTPEEIYNIGLLEVTRIKHLMDSVKTVVGFTGDLKAFFTYLNTDKKFTPFNTPGEVLDAFERIHQTMKPQLSRMFNHEPRIRFEIRQTEAFRAASASAEYSPGTIDGSRPGIFYVPILDARKFNVTSGMESLFLHEAIPGHHFQISLQMEDSTLPEFRRFGGNNAYIEGWALYTESLGKELGLYTDPYQYMGALGDEMHRAIRLVVDVGLHTKNLTREEAIQYMMDNEAISEQGATAEIERYMVIPAQALGYKIGALKIRELRNKYESILGPAFSLAAFHDQVLKYGAMPLDVLENMMDDWASIQKKK
jgi:uncharacterized protein (DUF885 family)